MESGPHSAGLMSPIEGARPKEVLLAGFHLALTPQAFQTLQVSGTRAESLRPFPSLAKSDSFTACGWCRLAKGTCG